MTLLLSRHKYILGLAVSRILHIMHDVLCLLHSCGNIHYAIATVWLYLLPSEQEKRNARFSAGVEQGVDAKRITSSCERCSLSVGIVSIRSKKPFGFSFILLLCSTYFEYSTDGVNGSEPLTTFVNPVHDITLFAYQLQICHPL